MSQAVNLEAKVSEYRERMQQLSQPVDPAVKISIETQLLETEQLCTAAKKRVDELEHQEQVSQSQTLINVPQYRLVKS